jgi:hypothetical protein
MTKLPLRGSRSGLWVKVANRNHSPAQRQTSGMVFARYFRPLNATKATAGAARIQSQIAISIFIPPGADLTLINRNSPERQSDTNLTQILYLDKP